MTKHITAAITAAFLLMIAAPVAAMAQTKIYVMDTDRVLTESAVGQHILNELQRIATEMDDELKAEGDPVKEELESFRAEVQSLDADALAERTDLAERDRELQGKVMRQAYLKEIKRAELEATKNQALAPVGVELAAVVEEIIENDEPDLLIERSLVRHASDNVDITDRIISDLNAKISTVDVTRVRAPNGVAPAESDGGAAE